ncbi:MAG: glycosyltransferase [Pseudobutyrivibrio sp.]|nr:glycosyltransferase [Pseudobutyrivibrio sp.]
MKASVVFLLYKPKWEKVKRTLDSIIEQEGMDFDLVIGDDGSENDLFPEIKAYLEEVGFEKPVKFNKCPENVGTVKNFYNATLLAEGEYIRSISPGDMFCGKTALKDFVNCALEADAAVAFTELIYYNMNKDGEITPVSQWVSPQYVSYKSQADFLKHYVLYNDLSIGFGILFRRKEFMEVMEKFVDRVKYCEDYAARVMIYAGQTACYCNKPTGLYEVGEGISSNDVWRQRLIDDWNVATEIMFEFNPDPALKRKFLRANSCNFCHSKLKKFLSYATMPGKLAWYIWDMFNPRYSKCKQY